MNSKGLRFALIGAAGYIAPRHMEAIKKNGGSLVAAYDPADSVGIMDRHFPECRFFTDFERFADFIDVLKRSNEGIDYVSICSPNHLHQSHAGFALRAGASAICEKPLVLQPDQIDELGRLEVATGQRIHTILQLRLHPSIIELREAVASRKDGQRFDCDLTYITSRGLWYYESWKGSESKSGGIATNIGVHFFDMLGYVFGPLEANIVHHRAVDCAAGFLEFKKARVRWFLSINKRDMTQDGAAQRCLDVNGFSFYDFSKGFEDLHTISYSEIIAGRGFPIEEVRPSIRIVSEIRNSPIEHKSPHQHPMLAKVLADTGRYRNGWPV